MLGGYSAIMRTLSCIFGIYELINVGGELFCDQKETKELRYFSRDNKPELFTKSHDDLWNDIFG